MESRSHECTTSTDLGEDNLWSISSRVAVVAIMRGGNPGHLQYPTPLQEGLVTH